jgi:hypothetical protein
VYQRIDMTQSMVNQSVMMKDSKFQYGYNNGFIGMQEGGRGFSKSGSLRLIHNVS